MPNLNTQILVDLPIILPHVEEQKRVSNVLKACDAKICASITSPACTTSFRARQKELMLARAPGGALVDTTLRKNKQITQSWWLIIPGKAEPER